MAGKTYTAMTESKMRGRLPKLQKGLILHDVLDEKTDLEMHADFGNLSSCPTRLIVYKVVDTNIESLPLLPLMWRDEDNECHSLWFLFGRDVLWWTIVGPVTLWCFWIQFTISRGARSGARQNSRTNWPAPEFHDGYVVSVAASNDKIFPLFVGPRMITRTIARAGDFRGTIMSDDSIVMYDLNRKGEVKYHRSVLSNEDARKKIPLIEFMEHRMLVPSLQYRSNQTLLHDLSFCTGYGFLSFPISKENPCGCSLHRFRLRLLRLRLTIETRMFCGPFYLSKVRQCSTWTHTAYMVRSSTHSDVSRCSA